MTVLIKLKIHRTVRLPTLKMKTIIPTVKSKKTLVSQEYTVTTADTGNFIFKQQEK